MTLLIVEDSNLYDNYRIDSNSAIQRGFKLGITVDGVAHHNYTTVLYKRMYLFIYFDE